MELGISVYPDLRPLDEIVEYFKLASQYGVTRVFSSMFSVEGTKEEVLNYFAKLIKEAHKYNLKVSLDVNPMLFEKLNASYDDLKVFNDIGVDTLRLDLDFGIEKDLVILNNPYGISIEFNTISSLVKDLSDHHADTTKFELCHNFYPQKYTGLKWEKFLKINKEIKEYNPNIKIATFISSNNRNTHGVWDAKYGLVTVERLRGLPIDLQARILLASQNVDDLLIGNAYASEQEFSALNEVMTTKNNNINEDPTLKMLISYGLIDVNKKAKKLRVKFDDACSELEKDIVLNYYPQLDMGDSSEWIWRNRLPRFIYSQKDKTIPYRECNKRVFDKGDVLIVNDHYKHYAGELQVVKIPFINDGQRNLVGHINEKEYLIMELVNDGDLVEFMEEV